jgi:hypothetical protein
MKIPLKGLVRNTPAGLAKEGEIEDMCNIRYKDGAWRPIPDRVAMFNGEQLPYINVYVHASAGYKNYLGVKYNEDVTLEYFAKDNSENVPTLLDVPITLATLEDVYATLTQIGNVVNIKDSTLRNLIWYNDSYMLLPTDFDGEKNSTTVGLVKVDFAVDPLRTSNLAGRLRRWYYGSRTSDWDNAKEQVFGLFPKAIAGETSQGQLTGFCLACYAIELYDGSYILHSNPVLLGAPWDSGNRYNFTLSPTTGGTPVTFDYINNPVGWSTGSSNIGEDYADILPYNPIPGNNTEYEYASNETLGVQFQEGMYPVYDLNHYSNSVRSFPWIYGMFKLADHVAQHPYVSITSNSLLYRVANNINASLEPLIKSISLFITPQVSPLKDIEKSSQMATVYTSFSQTQSSSQNNYYYPYKTDAEIRAELLELKNFYKVHEIPFDSIEAEDWMEVDLKGKLGDNLLTLPVLNIDNLTHHSILPEVQFVYNSKLHVANYESKLSRGFPLPYFFRYYIYTKTSSGQFISNNQALYGYKFYCVVKLQTNKGTTQVVRDGLFGIDGFMTEYSIGPLISYPDSRAISLEIIAYKNNTGVGNSYTRRLEFKLKPSNTGNFAYYLTDDMKPIQFGGNVIDNSFQAPAESNQYEVYQNTMKVSEVNNPFNFPVANTYQVGSGRIVGLATNTMALSTGQFGQFPVYVFCTDGIYGLYVGGAEVNYSNIIPVSREVCNNPNSIKAIDKGVIFTTDKGIMIIAGSQETELSEMLKGEVFDLNKLPLFKQALGHAKLVSLESQFTTNTIKEFIQSCIVGYNYAEREIWFTERYGNYSYIFSNGLWYKVNQKGQQYVNDYPKQYLLDDIGRLIDISSETGDYQQVYILTRPMKMGDVEFKQMLTSIIRGHILVENTGIAPTIQKKWAGIHVYGSYDGERWVFLGGNEKTGELNDFGTRVERTDCKYFRIAFYGNINNASTINFLEIEGKQSILSNKLR